MTNDARMIQRHTNIIAKWHQHHSNITTQSYQMMTKSSNHHPTIIATRCQHDPIMISKWFQIYTQMSRHLFQNDAKTMSKSMPNLWIFGTCDFLIFAKSITLKSFFYMIRGTRNASKIHNKSMQNRCSKKVCRNFGNC